MMFGEVYDSGREPDTWHPVCLCHEHTEGKLISAGVLPVREKEIFLPEEFRDEAGNRILDFGQKVRLPGPPEILENQYETAKRWVEFERACAREKNELYLENPEYHTIGEDGVPDSEYLLDNHFQFGEWNEPIGDGVTFEQIFARIKTGDKIPANTTAHLLLENGEEHEVGSGTYRFVIKIQQNSEIL